jgi:hypothetical protein
MLSLFRSGEKDMKLLMIYADKFAYKTSEKTLESVEAYEEDKQIEDVLVRFIQVEKEDEEKKEF